MKIYQHMLLHPFCFTAPHFSRKIQLAVPCNDHDCVGKLSLGTRWADVSCIFNIVIWPTGCYFIADHLLQTGNKSNQ